MTIAKKYLEVNGLLVPCLEDPQRWGSHLPLLTYYALMTDGPILEMGVGQWSTPVLHAICENMGRDLVSVEEDTAWREKFLHYQSPRHKFLSSFDDPSIDAGQWDVVLIDHVRERRNPDLHRLRNNSLYIVCHDTGVEPWYGYDFSTFAWAKQYTGLWGFTTVCTNTALPTFHASEAQEPFTANA